MKRIIKEFYKQVDANKLANLGNLGEMDKFIE
jgi:hypothetical protein